MRVFIYIEGFSKKFPTENEKFLIQLLDEVARSFPEFDFTFLNGPGINNTLIWKGWLNYKLPATLKKHEATLFIGSNVCSLKTKTPQCLLVTDPFVHGSKKHISFYKRNLPKFLKKANSVVCFSINRKNEMISSGEKVDRLHVIPPAAEKIFKPIQEHDKDTIKRRLTEGTEYFICIEELNDQKKFIDLLKAFSIFKKMQQSNMKLVLTGRMGSAYKKLSVDLDTYKYKDAVIMNEPVSLEELAKSIASAYALILPSGNDTPGVQTLQAIQSGIPVIAAKETVTYEIAGDAALYFNAGDQSDLASQMMCLYKDEDLRKRLIENGRRIAMHYSIENSAKLLKQAIEDALT